MAGPTQHDYIAAAGEAVAYVKRVVEHGSANNAGEVVANRLIVGNVLALYRKHRENTWEDQQVASRHTTFPALAASEPRAVMQIFADAASNFKIGNCGEQSALAFTFLEKRSIRPIEWMEFTDQSHSFVILGRRAGSDLGDFADWTEGAALCDPWRPGFGVAGLLALWYRKYNFRSMFRLD